MPEINVSPTANCDIVADQNAVFLALSFTFTDENDNPVDFEGWRIFLEVKESNSGDTVLLWDTEDDTVALAASEEANPDELKNVVTLVERTAEYMNHTAKNYVYNFWFTSPEVDAQPVKYFAGAFILNPTS